MKATILFVDDDAGMLESIRRMFHSMRDVWTILTASSVRDARLIIAQTQLDVLVLDVNLPEEGGLELLEELKKKPDEHRFEIIMFTGLKDDGLKRRALDLGATDLLCKPVSKEDLIARLQSVIRMKRSRDTLRWRTEELEKEIDLRITIERKLQNAMEELQDKNHLLEELSTRDPLTKLYNRRFFAAKLTEYCELSHRLNHPLSCIISDLDHFKLVNDNFGHQAGDVVLAKTAEILSLRIRKSDIIARYGGEEFVIILPNTPIEAALKLAEKLRSAIESASWLIDGNDLKVTISMGVSANSEDFGKHLVQTADEALYDAKKAGRNRVKVFVEKG